MTWQLCYRILNCLKLAPERADTPLCLEMISSFLAKAWVADVRGAFSQGLRGQRPEPLFATPPGGIPGEDEDVLVEIRAEIYGLIEGPPCLEEKFFHNVQGTWLQTPSTCTLSGMHV